jgi:hypothetical protein
MLSRFIALSRYQVRSIPQLKEEGDDRNNHHTKAESDNKNSAHLRPEPAGNFDLRNDYSDCLEKAETLMRKYHAFETE